MEYVHMQYFCARHLVVGNGIVFVLDLNLHVSCRLLLVFTELLCRVAEYAVSAALLSAPL